MSSYIKYEDNRIPSGEASISDARTQHPAITDDSEIRKLAFNIRNHQCKELSDRLQNQDASREIYLAGSQAVIEEVSGIGGLAYNWLDCLWQMSFARDENKSIEIFNSSIEDLGTLRLPAVEGRQSWIYLHRQILNQFAISELGGGSPEICNCSSPLNGHKACEGKYWKKIFPDAVPDRELTRTIYAGSAVELAIQWLEDMYSFLWQIRMNIEEWSLGFPGDFNEVEINGEVCEIYNSSPQHFCPLRVELLADEMNLAFQDHVKVQAMLERERILLSVHPLSGEMIGQSVNFTKRIRRHRWGLQEAAAADQFIREFKKNNTRSLREFCGEYAILHNMSASTLYKKLTDHRGTWDPNREFGGRNNGH